VAVLCLVAQALMGTLLALYLVSIGRAANLAP
jgi:hypothetical protein